MSIDRCTTNKFTANRDFYKKFESTWSSFVVALMKRTRKVENKIHIQDIFKIIFFLAVLVFHKL